MVCIGLGQIGVPFSIGEIELDGPQAGRDGFVELAIPIEGPSQHCMSRRTIGGQLHRPAGLPYGLGSVVAQGEKARPGDEHLWIGRLQTSGLLVGGDGLIQPALLVGNLRLGQERGPASGGGWRGLKGASPFGAVGDDVQTGEDQDHFHGDAQRG